MAELPARLLMMKEERRQFLSVLRDLPLRVTAEEVAWMLNCAEHDVPCLVRAKLLKPLGKPTRNARKFFDPEEILKRRKDRSWKDKVSDTIYAHWRNANE